MKFIQYRQNALRLKAVLFAIAKVHGMTLLLAVAFTLAITNRFQLALNMTESLPQTLFLIDKKKQTLHRDDYFAFRWTQGGPIPNGIVVIKQIKGVVGDAVSQTQVDGQRFIAINNTPIAKVKAKARNGKRLLPLAPTNLMKGEYFAYAPHPDSLDSRYALTGVIKASQVVGRAYPLF